MSTITLKQVCSIEAQRKVDLDYQFKATQLAVNNGVELYLLVSSSTASDQSNYAYSKMKVILGRKIKALPFKSISIIQPSMLMGQRKKVGSELLSLLCLIPGRAFASHHRRAGSD